MRRWTECFSHMKIRTKMLLSYILIFFIAVLAVGIFMYFYMTQMYKKQLLYSANQAFEQAQEFVSYRVNSVIYASNLIRVNESIQTVLKKPREEVEKNIIQQNTDRMVMENYIYSICDSAEVYQISLYVPRYLTYSNQQVLFLDLDELQETEAYERLEASEDSGVWMPPQMLYSADTNETVEVISYLQKVPDISNLHKSIGVQRISVERTDISSILQKSNITEQGIIWIENSSGEMISCSNHELYGELEEDIEWMREENVPQSWETKEINGKDYLVRGTDIEKTDWKLLVAMPETELYRASSSVLRLLLPIILILALAVGAMALVFSRMITSRISHLAAQMESVEDKIPQLSDSEMESDDEIGQLFKSFRYMSNRLQELMNQEYENGKAVKQAELKALQAQINPHFLYNTLDLINWEALDCGAKRIMKISRALAKFYKLSLNHGEEFSNVKDELSHVEYYIMIQNFRYNDRIEMIREVPEELMENRILHIVLQPLAENFFVHGMVGKEETAILRIRIRGWEEMEDMVLEVADNGCGMTKEEREKILSEEATERSGYGVRNIHKRIQLVYGENYGLEYRENEWGGVSVRLRFPKESNI